MSTRAPTKASKPKPKDNMVRITASVTIDQIDRMDNDRIRVRRKFRKTLDRSALIRGLLEGYRTSGLNLVKEGISNEAELAELVAARLKANKS